MSDVQERADQLSEELLDREIPCGGWGGGNPCGRAAVLRRVAWHCQDNREACRGHAAEFKCVQCYTALVADFYRRINKRCRQCKTPLTYFEELAKYEPF